MKKIFKFLLKIMIALKINRYLKRIYFLIKKTNWLIKFKLKYRKSPLFIKTSFEHRKLASLNINPELVIDAGFNNGQFSSLVLEIWKNSKVVAFDPSPINSKYYASVLKKIYLERFDFKNIGLSNNCENLNFNLSKSLDSSSYLQPTKLNNEYFSSTKIVNSVKTKVETLANQYYLMDIPFPWFLKIDIQGYEMNLLNGIDKNQLKKIKWIYIEMTDYEMYRGQMKRKYIKQWLLENNFVLSQQINVDKSAYGKIIYSDELYENKKSQ